MSDSRYDIVRVELSPQGVRYFHLKRHPASMDDSEITEIIHAEAFRILQEDDNALMEVSMGDDQGHCMESEDSFEMYVQ